MATKIMVVGKSGTGKTESLRTLDPKITAIICPDKKNLPFRGWRKNYKSAGEDGKFDRDTCNFFKTSDWVNIRGFMKYVDTSRPEIKTLVIDTITYAMIGEFISKAKATGFSKFTEMGANFFETLDMIDGMRDDLTVIIMAHTEDKSFNGVDSTKFGVPGGKLVSDVIKPEGMFNITLETSIDKEGDEVKYSFMTSSNTVNMARSPLGMFETTKIPNDMDIVLKAIKTYEEG